MGWVVTDDQKGINALVLLQENFGKSTQPVQKLKDEIGKKIRDTFDGTASEKELLQKPFVQEDFQRHFVFVAEAP